MIEQGGKVYLVGSGPGDVAYLTVRGYQLLTQAEVLIYDALAEEELLQFVSEKCLKINVGKRGGQPSTPQTEIDRLLVEHCLQGKQVVRLKSGDPFIFGRSTSEIQALVAADCAFEVVPGISSAIAAPLFAGIPLTDVTLSRCFAVATAHDLEALNWPALAQIDTLTLLMGGRNLAEIVARLQQQGRSPDTPIAIVRWAGRPRQQVWVGTLATIAAQTTGVSLSPCVITIGEVVQLRDYLQSPTNRQNDTQPNPMNGLVLHSLLPTTETVVSTPEQALTTPLPLAGKTVLVTRSVGQSSEFCDRLQAIGAQVVEMPALEIGPPSSWQELDQAIAQLYTFNWLVLTSTNAVDYFFERLAAQGKDARALAGVKIAVVGQKTAASLGQRGLNADFTPPDFVADSLVAHFPEASLQGAKILFPRVESGGREVLVKEFTAQGAEVVEVAAYQSGCPGAIAPAALNALQQGSVDIVTFASSKTVKHFCQLVEAALGHSFLIDELKRACIASIGPQTSKTCLERFGRVEVEAQEYTLPGLTQAIAQWASKGATERARENQP
ncbi:uroporphyrinogen-III C-methyltransferase [Trichocoleus desertorum]|uniref:uroporphyrinogen-III C-methyltransferase n=2 Tax=Trichocoleus TaxID=450526 RepID=A0ABV0J577_9CYAN|nr:uroporphyrinogen-III C-methyltransferase [Trichocoleus sp. FACHB-46]MBD1863767.1 uroporphyrinogen-III C-methyltransferase [Trichocoleus sp. FACHB-46]